jgi:hypothetical protein
LFKLRAAKIGATSEFLIVGNEAGGLIAYRRILKTSGGE